MMSITKSKLKSTWALGRNRHFLAALFVLLTFASPLRAAEAPENSAGEKVTLIAGSAMSVAPVLVGVHMTMQEGWHTYWRTPGDSGLAPTFDWSASKNVASLELLWPVPQRFDAEGDTTFGYKDEVFWPVLVRAVDPAQPLMLNLKMSYGICKNICVPNEVHLTLTILPVPSERTDAERTDAESADAAHLWLTTLLRVPHAPKPPVAVMAKLVGEELQVVLSGVSEVPEIIPEATRGFWFGPPVVSQSGKDVIYKMPVEIGKGRVLKGFTVTMVFSGPKTAIEAKVKVE